MMEQLPENNPVQDAGSVVTPAVSLGKALREARERAGLSVADMAHQIKFAPRQIEALEADDFQHLPEMAFVRGFVRSYAKILNLDAQPLLEALPHSNVSPLPLMPASVEVPYPVATSPQLHNLIWLGAALLLSVLVVAFAVWHFTTPITQPEVAQVEIPVALPSAMQIIPASPVVETGVIAPPVEPLAQHLSMVAQSSIAAAKPLISPPSDKSFAAKSVTPTQPPKPAAQPAAVAPPLPVKPAVQPAALVPPQPAKSAAQPAPPQPTKTVAQPAAVAQTQPVKPVTQPTALPPPQPVKSAIPSGKSPTTLLHLAFDEESWVEIRDKEGNIISSQINPRGSELRMNVSAPFSLVIGHAASVHLYHRGKQVDLAPHTNSSSEVARLTLE